MMHPATCHVWHTGEPADCDCPTTPADRGFRIRKHPRRTFAWRIDRHTHDGEYIHFMGCSTFNNALSMVNQILWLRANALTEDRRNVR